MNNPYPYGYETWGEKLTRKVKENPWVPAGCLATTGALIMSAVKMRSGESKHMNYWMRARVGLQGLTLVALVAGTMALRAEREKAALLEQAAVVAETGMTIEQVQRAREKDEFEVRLKEAEREVEADRALLERINEAKKSAVVGSVPSAVDSVAPSESGKKSWWKVW